MSLEAQKALSAAWDKLTKKLIDKEEELSKLERSEGGNWRKQQKLTRLAKEIESLKARLDRCETAMENVGSFKF